ncbi:MAG: hypothetical protein ACR2OH_13130 [Microthrixaceae bacterium]
MSSPTVSQQRLTDHNQSRHPGSCSSGLSPTQESLLLAVISTAGVVLVGIGAPVISAWSKRRFGTSDDEEYWCEGASTAALVG